MGVGVYNNIKLHIYRKAIVKPHYYADARPIQVYVDDKYIGDMNAGTNTIIDITPGAHKMVIKAPGFLMAPVEKEFVVNENSTDVFIAFRGRLGKYINPKIFELIQYNAAELSNATEKNTTINICCEDISLKHFIWTMVIVDDKVVGYMDGKNRNLTFNISSGKHKVIFETFFEVGYAFLDVKEDCDNMFVMINEEKIVDIQSHSKDIGISKRQVKCVFSRARMFPGCAATVKVIIDGNNIFYIKNGETKEMFLSEGRHTVVTKANGFKTRELVISQNCNKVTVYMIIDNIQSIVNE